MGKQDQGSAAAEGTRRATGGAADRRPWGAVLGQAQARDSAASRAVGITAARASHWRAQFLAAGQAGLKSRATDARDEDHRRLQAKIGELLMETELLYAKVDQLEASGPLARRRSTRCVAPSRSPPVGRMACSGSAACGTAPAPACMRGVRRPRPRRRVVAAVRSAPPRMTWLCTSSCAKAVSWLRLMTPSVRRRFG